MLPRPSVLVASVLAAALSLPSPVQALNWTSTRTKPVFSEVGGERIRGVNLGGWFVLENWMTSELFAVPPLDQHFPVADEWSYCRILGKEEATKRLTAHWDTYITENDFKEIAAAGLNSVRIPISFWAFVALEGNEPYVQGQIPYLQKALGWALEHNLDVMVDLHGVPGSQNSFDNSGVKNEGGPAWSKSDDNVYRSLQALGALTKIVTDPKYLGVVKAIEVLNEPLMDDTGKWGATWDKLSNYYLDAYDTIRWNETVIEGHPKTMVIFHDAFQKISNWEHFFTDPSLGAHMEQFGLDTHVYEAFNGNEKSSNPEHLAHTESRLPELKKANSQWMTIVGEMSLGTGIYCTPYTDCLGVNATMPTTYSVEESAFRKEFWKTQKKVFEEGAAGWYMWSWKTDAAAPWSFKESLKQGWIESLPKSNPTSSVVNGVFLPFQSAITAMSNGFKHSPRMLRDRH